ncbi:hypothetical protein DFQ27_004729 [Actinomortierella ambigua]|uniref:Microbial-type PARG catalytic domain-containing protein n=1 Tax=Actinomortierella ambigua TaxID=1343610 RepID=A0A9P6Q351_9FUNG|nr:hypothetical protein DFQ27_004729 [Actinomortierella ambigua]
MLQQQDLEKQERQDLHNTSTLYHSNHLTYAATSNGLSPHHHVATHHHHSLKPITIRTSSIDLPTVTNDHAQSRVSRLLRRGSRIVSRLVVKVKRHHRRMTRYTSSSNFNSISPPLSSKFLSRSFRRIENRWSLIRILLVSLILLYLVTRLVLSTLSWGFTRPAPLGPRMAETLQAFEQLQYTSAHGSLVIMDKSKLFSGVKRAKLYDGSRIRRQIMDAQDDPIIRVVNEDCLDEALRLKKRGRKPIVLDMANRVYPGGDYRQDGATQEAGLFRRTNLYQCLDMEPRRGTFYPIPSQGGVYCPNMIVIRKSEKDNNEFLERPEWMSILAMPPLRNPPLVKNENDEMVLADRAAILVRKKIQAMFRIALENGYDSIVLSAFGCGRLHNPPEEMAQIFKEVIKTFYMGGIKKGRTFKEIVFAITSYQDPDDPNVDEYLNFKTFKDVMEREDEPEPLDRPFAM